MAETYGPGPNVATVHKRVIVCEWIHKGVM